MRAFKNRLVYRVGLLKDVACLESNNQTYVLLLVFFIGKAVALVVRLFKLDMQVKKRNAVITYKSITLTEMERFYKIESGKHRAIFHKGKIPGISNVPKPTIWESLRKKQSFKGFGFFLSDEYTKWTE
ncbi:hypothetical protein J3Q64DRAFT_1698915 [Phycomyces blakesleeanus]|uniref:Uncharacterized protein n=2 Tax=Phycomyces blakesleeanus TaxID=4837 RepID=A0A162NCX9_PHYB8|nr:hypothetical protein PHYBLDRAFT_187015 [Phycomyces blakesleeanus NRRL 1555(-)]OAD73178.1 hypothetical protein PHYBLDRAFT_187015 [Phycomyces blakesleeanus NRRL 1555(-)]|eukprot:XP_018291218.1 hypothetical protein PHYBLDRAFT_187015 [Phycomyces blakesleeanus NRRL 1555(-)]